MTTRWFGKRYPAPAYEPQYQMPTPVGVDCCHCDEPVAAGDDGWMYSNGPVAHRECYMRAIVGSVEHQQKPLCDRTCRDDPRLTKRQAAKAALEYWEANRG